MVYRGRTTWWKFILYSTTRRWWKRSKKKKKFKLLNPDKLVTTLPILLAQTKARINSFKVTLFRLGFFRAAHRWEWGKDPHLPKICHTYPTMMKVGTVIPYPKKKVQRRSKKYMKHVKHSLSSADISIFHRKSLNFAISRNTDTHCILYIISTSFHFSWVIKEFFNKFG